MAKESKEEELSKTYWFTKRVDYDSSKELIEWLFKHQEKGNKDEVTVFINSCGGLTSSAFAIIDAFKLVDFSVKTIGYAYCASAATLILFAGDKRTLFPQTMLYLHEPFYENKCAYGKNQNKINFDSYELDFNRLVKYTAKYSGLNKKQVKKLIQNDVYITAKQAYKLGFIDEILKPSKAHKN